MDISKFILGVVFAFNWSSVAVAAAAPPVLISSPSLQMNCVNNDGALSCWGKNDLGQIGDGTRDNSPFPQIIIPSGVTQVSLGGLPDALVGHACAIVGSALKCWGDNQFHQLGDGTTDTALTPKTIPLGAGLVPASVATGAGFTCVAFADKSAKCWGDNSMGQLGYGVVGDIPHPTDNTADPLNWAAATSTLFKSGSTVLKTITQIKAGVYHACAFFGTSMRCWGDNTYGQTGSSDTSGPVLSPTQVMAGVDDTMVEYPLINVVAFKLGGGHTCAIITSTTVNRMLKCWGSGTYLQLGGGTSADTPYGVVTMANDVTQFDLGFNHTCFVRYGAAKCLGFNLTAQLGDGTTNDAAYPKLVAGGRFGVNQIAAGYDTTCGLFGTTNVMKCWGNNEFGQVGDNRDANDNPDYPLVLKPASVSPFILRQRF